MKKIIKCFVFVLILFSFISVNAKELKVSLLEDKGKLCYDGKIISEDDFTKEMDLTSYEEVSSEVVIENNTTSDQKVYFLMDTKAQDGSFNDLLDYLTLRVSVDDKVVYAGSASVINFATEKEDLQDFVPLGVLKKASRTALKVDVLLSREYANVSNNTFAYLNFELYTQNKEKEFVKIEALTSDQFYNWLDIWIFSGFCIVVAAVILIIHHILKKKKENTEEEVQEKQKEEK